MVTSRHDADHAVYNALIVFRLTSSTSLVETTIFAFTRLNAWNVHVIEVFCEKKSCRGLRQKKYFNTFGKFLRSPTTQLMKAIRELAKRWHPKESEVSTEKKFADLRKKLVVDMSHSATRILFLSPLSTAFLAIDAH